MDCFLVLSQMDRQCRVMSCTTMQQFVCLLQSIEPAAGVMANASADNKKPQRMPKRRTFLGGDCGWFMFKCLNCVVLRFI